MPLILKSNNHEFELNLSPTNNREFNLNINYIESVHIDSIT